MDWFNSLGISIHYEIIHSSIFLTVDVKSDDMVLRMETAHDLSLDKVLLMMTMMVIQESKKTTILYKCIAIGFSRAVLA